MREAVALVLFILFYVTFPLLLFGNWVLKALRHENHKIRG
jgi:hypothetical protein